MQKAEGRQSERDYALRAARCRPQMTPEEAEQARRIFARLVPREKLNGVSAQAILARLPGWVAEGIRAALDKSSTGEEKSGPTGRDREREGGRV
jgi:hypothetical protein